MDGQKNNQSAKQEESPSQMVGGSGSSSKKRERFVPYMPDGIIYSIFLYLPVQVLYYVMRLLCRQWYSIIHSPEFIADHMRRSKLGVLFIDQKTYFSGVWDISNRRIESTNLGYRFLGQVSSTCNGLVLMCACTSLWRYYICNPVTKRQWALPETCMRNPSNVLSCLGFLPTSREYKVVHIYYQFHEPCFHSKILTVGTDREWRDLPSFEFFSKSVHSRAFSVRGLLYWPSRFSPSVISLDLETETFKVIKLPKSCFGFVEFLSSQQYLYAFHRFTLFEFTFECWVLMEPKAGEWTRLPDIGLRIPRDLIPKGEDPEVCDIIPVGWLEEDDLVILCIKQYSSRFPNYCIVYSLKRAEFQMKGDVLFTFPLDTDDYYLHINTLVSLDGLQ